MTTTNDHTKGLRNRMRYVILGGGSVTAEFYLPAMARLGRLADLTVVDPAQRSLDVVKSKSPDVTCILQDHQSFLGNLSTPIDGSRLNIIVAVPNSFHVEAVQLALERGCNVLCEKPLALKAAECAGLRTLAAAKGALLKVAMSRRYLPAHLLAREIVHRKELGDVRSIEVHDCGLFLWRPRSFSFFARESGGMLADMGVHYLDYLDTLVGSMTPLDYSDDARGGTESGCKYRLEAGGVEISMRLSRIEQSGSFIRIVCERGEIRIEKLKEAEVTVTPKGAGPRRVTLEHPFDEPTWPNSFGGSFCQMLADFEREVRGVKTGIADVTDAERTVALIEWAYAQRDRTAAPRVSAGAASAEPQELVVTGATGFIGGHLLERLTAIPSSIRVAVRSPSSCTNVARYPVAMTPTNLLDLDQVRALVKGARTVYHLAYGKEADAARITIEGTRNVVKAAIEASVDCVVIMSTMYVYGFPETGRAVDETFPYRPYGGEYGTSKAAMEKWCIEQARNSGKTRIVVLNPTCVYGPGGGAYTTLPIDLARLGTFCWIDGGQGSCNYNYVENLIDAIVAAATIPEAHGHRFIINDGVTTWRDFFEPLLRPLAAEIPSYSLAELGNLPRYGGPFKVKDLVGAMVSAPEIRQVAKRSAAIRRAFDLSKRVGPVGISGAGAGVSGSEGPTTQFPPEWLGPLYGPARVTFSAKKAHDILKWTPRITLAAAQAATLEWLMETGQVPRGD